MNETWQQAAAREMKEEANIHIEPSEIMDFRVISALDTNAVIIFGVCTPKSEKNLPPFTPNKEATERVVVRDFQPLAYDIHSNILKELLAKSLANKNP